MTDKQTSTAAWYARLRAENNAAFMPLYFDKHRYLVLKGGGGSGKSIFAGRKVLERVTSEPGHRWLVCRKVQRTIRESCFKQLIGQLSDHYPESGYKVNKSDLLISLGNGSEIIFAGLDDVEKLKSIYNITGIWIEEASELTQIILSFNPVSITHWLKKRFFDRKEPRARVHESTYKDNRFLDAEQIQVLEGYKETDEYYYDVYCLGQWGTTGRSVFNAAAIQRRLSTAPKPLDVGYFAYDYDGAEISNIRWESDPDGYVKLYAPPEKLAPYVIGGDTAGEGSDSFVAQVLDNRTGAQVATLRHTFDEDVYARQIYCLGTYYNTALIGVEVNFSTYPVRELERLPAALSEAVRPRDGGRVHA